MRLARTARARLAHLPVPVAGALVFSLFSCGYAFVGAGALGPASTGREVAITALENHTAEPEASLVATRAVTRALGRAGAGRDVQKPAAVLSGAVELARAIPIGITGPQVVETWRAEGKLRLVLRDAQSNARLAETSVTGTEEFTRGTDVEATEVARRLALERLFERLATEALAQL